MKFQLLENVFNVRDFECEEPIISPHTGKKIERMYIGIKLIGESMNNTFKAGRDNLEKGNIFSIDEEENVIKEYKLLNSSYSYSGNNASTNTELRYRLHLEEVEKLEIKSLIIRDLEIFPYQYNETYDERKDSIIIEAKVKLTENEAAEILNTENDKIYFTVLRNGISEDKLGMRFGTVIWSKIEENIKLNLIIVEKKYDEDGEKTSQLFEPEISNIMSILSYTKNLNNELLELLISKKLVSVEEIDAIKKKANDNKKKTMRDFFEVKDIDDFL